MATNPGAAAGPSGAGVITTPPQQPPQPVVDNRLPSVNNLRNTLAGKALNDSITQFVISQEELRGGFFAVAETTTYFFDGTSKKLYPIGSGKNPDLNFCAFLTKYYGLVSTEMITSYVLARLDAYARLDGKTPEVKRFSWYNKENKCLYLSRYNGTCFKLTGTEVITIDNGTEVLFLDDDRGMPCDPDIGKHGILLPGLVNDLHYETATAGGLTPEAQKIIMTSWLFCVAFGDLIPATPILLLEGVKGSGKSSTIERIQLMTHGVTNNRIISQSDEADFGVYLLRSPIALLDNIDKYIDWLADALAAYVTGGSWVRRKKYTDTTEVLIQPRSFIAVATRNPASFRRDDIADRCLIIRLSRLEDVGFQSLLAFRETVLSQRSKLYGEWLYYLNAIVEKLKTATIKPSVHRLSDFVHLTEIICSVLDIKGAEEALALMQLERNEFTLEGDPLVGLLELWIAEEKNIGREISAGDLHKELGMLAMYNNVNFPYKNSKSLASRLRDAGSAMQRRITIVRNMKQHQTIYAFFRV